MNEAWRRFRKDKIAVVGAIIVLDAGGEGAAPMLWSGGMAWIADYPDPIHIPVHYEYVDAKDVE